jgi:hypothetical protein
MSSAIVPPPEHAYAACEMIAAQMSLGNRDTGATLLPLLLVARQDTGALQRDSDRPRKRLIDGHYPIDGTGAAALATDT